MFKHFPVVIGGIALKCLAATVQEIVTAFTPSQLFTSGEEGVWFDVSDMATLFQDSAGTTPVTAVEQPVGRILDKSGRGNHATQTISTARPTLRARYNLLLNSATLATQSVTTLATNYTLKFAGAGSITLSGTKTGTYTAGTHTLTGITAGTLTLTVSGSVTTAQLTTAQYASLPYQWITSATSYDADPTKFPPYLYFDGVDDYMSLGDVLDLGLTSMTMCVAANIERSESTVLAKALSGNTAYRYALMCTNLNHLHSLYVPVLYFNVYSPAQNLTFKTNVLTSVIDRAGSVSFQIDDAVKQTTAYVSNVVTDSNTPYRFLIGAYNDSTDTGIVLPMKGPIYQIVVVKRLLTTQETSDTKAFLAAKAGITL